MVNPPRLMIIKKRKRILFWSDSHDVNIRVKLTRTTSCFVHNLMCRTLQLVHTGYEENCTSLGSLVVNLNQDGTL